MAQRTAVLLALAALSACGSTGSQPEQTAPTHEQVCSAESFLFVQNTTAGSYDGERLTLTDVGPTIFFTDRPYRVFGHADPGDFVEAWKRGPNSFASDPPNAILSLIADGEVQSCMVALSDPSYVAGDLSYKVTLEDGEIPASFSTASLFIDNEAWAAVGGLAAGVLLSRRHERQQAAAFEAGRASAVEAPGYYYQSGS